MQNSAQIYIPNQSVRADLEILHLMNDPGFLGSSRIQEHGFISRVESLEKRLAAFRTILQEKLGNTPAFLQRGDTVA